MDLKTLQDRLRSGQITTVSEFKRELDLIWENCITFNSSIHPLSIIAGQARSQVNERWNACGLPPPSHAVDQLRDLRKVITELQASMSSLLPSRPRPEIPERRALPKAVPRPPKPKPVVVEQPVKVVEAVPNHPERKIIAEKLRQSPVADMRRAWDIVKPYLNVEAQERKSFLLNSLPDSVLIELKKVVLT
jgi:hypothetical protein